MNESSAGWSSSSMISPDSKLKAGLFAPSLSSPYFDRSGKPTELQKAVDRVIQLRNKVAHPRLPTSDEEAQEILDEFNFSEAKAACCDLLRQLLFLKDLCLFSVAAMDKVKGRFVAELCVFRGYSQYFEDKRVELRKAPPEKGQIRIVDTRTSACLSLHPWIVFFSSVKGEQATHITFTEGGAGSGDRWRRFWPLRASWRVYGAMAVVVVGLWAFLLRPGTVLRREAGTLSTGSVQPEATVPEARPSATAEAASAVHSGAQPASGPDAEEMALIPAGEFRMGSEAREALSSEKPVHRVYVDAFYMDRHEVTNRRFSQFVQATGYRTEAEQGGGGTYWNGKERRQDASVTWRHPYVVGDGIDDKLDLPVVRVSWNDAVAFCRWAGKRLPTEAEWEKAARGGRGQGSPRVLQGPSGEAVTEEDGKYPWGDGSPQGKACFGFSAAGGRPMSVGSYAPNGYGLYDVAGNAWEWCSDWYGEEFYKVSPSRNPSGPSSGTTVGAVLTVGRVGGISALIDKLPCRRSSATWTLLATMLSLAVWLVAPRQWIPLPHPIYLTWGTSLLTFIVVAAADPRKIYSAATPRGRRASGRGSPR